MRCEHFAHLLYSVSGAAEPRERMTREGKGHTFLSESRAFFRIFRRHLDRI